LTIKSSNHQIPPAYFKDQSVPVISYIYTTPIKQKYLTTRRCCKISILTISSLSLLIAPVKVLHSYIIRLATLTLELVTLTLSTTPLYQIFFAKGQKCREPKSTNWRHNFKIIIITDSVYDYAGQCAKRDKEDLDTLFEWLKSVRSLIQIRIKNTQWVNEHSYYINL